MIRRSDLATAAPSSPVQGLATPGGAGSSCVRVAGRVPNDGSPAVQLLLGRLVRLLLRFLRQSSHADAILRDHREMPGPVRAACDCFQNSPIVRIVVGSGKTQQND